jgi:hypothetical protein
LDDVSTIERPIRDCYEWGENPLDPDLLIGSRPASLDDFLGGASDKSEFRLSFGCSEHVIPAVETFSERKS